MLYGLFGNDLAQSRAASRGKYVQLGADGAAWLAICKADSCH